MNILFIGDIYGKPGRETVKEFLPKFKKDKKIDLVIANVENLAHGKGITENTLNEMLESGIDFFTGGNHIFAKGGEEILSENKFPLIRPANYPKEAAGEGFEIIEKNKKRILIINLLGQTFMTPQLDCPFSTIKRILEENNDVDFVIVDFHAEASSEKAAMKFFLDSKVTALMGTHTHVTTADLQITEGKMAYISDAGMTGLVDDSVIGVDKDVILDKFLTKINKKHKIAENGNKIFAAVLIETAKEKYAKAATLFYKNL